jgi:hypothetical protein
MATVSSDMALLKPRLAENDDSFERNGLLRASTSRKQRPYRAKLLSSIPNKQKMTPVSSEAAVIYQKVRNGLFSRFQDQKITTVSSGAALSHASAG